jgi:quercetin dioxygenase-like cupin family protein
MESVLHPRVKLNGPGLEAAPYGRIGANWSARPHRYGAGEVHKGHSHVLEHVTFLQSGQISVKRNDREAPTVYVGPMWIEMPAQVWHEITAVTEALWWCVFFDHRSPGELAPFDAERG